MRHIIQSTFKQVMSDRLMMFLTLAMLVGGIAYIVFVGFTIKAQDTQLAIRYTAFSEVQIYPDKWYYLLNFVALGVLFLIAHIGMSAKLFAIGLKDLAQAFGAFSLIVLLLMFVYTYHVLFDLAYLG